MPSFSLPGKTRACVESYTCIHTDSRSAPSAWQAIEVYEKEVVSFLVRLRETYSQADAPR